MFNLFLGSRHTNKVPMILTPKRISRIDCTLQNDYQIYDYEKDTVAGYDTGATDTGATDRVSVSCWLAPFARTNGGRVPGVQWWKGAWCTMVEGCLVYKDKRRFHVRQINGRILHVDTTKHLSII